MEYSLIKINELSHFSNAGEVKGGDLVLVEIQNDSGKWITANAQVDELFNTSKIKLANSSLFSVQLGEFAQELGLGDKMTHQEDFNRYVGVMLSRLLSELRNKPEIILSDTQPKASILEYGKTEFSDGTLWIDTTNYKVYVHQMMPDSKGYSAMIPTWIGLTDR